MSNEAVRVKVEIFVANRVELARIDAMHGPSAVGWACVDCTDWLDGMDRLAADVTGQDVSVFGDHQLVFPEGDASKWDGPWLVQVPDDVVRVLAEVTDDQLDAFEAGRSEHEAVRDGAIFSRSVLAARSSRLALLGAELRELCQQAMAERRGVYQWSTA